MKKVLEEIFWVYFFGHPYHSNGTRIHLDAALFLGFPEFKNHMVALGVDSAAANSGKRSGVRIIIKEEVPWMPFVWYMTLRLKLAI